MIEKIVEDKRLLVMYIVVIGMLAFGITYASLPDLVSNYLTVNNLRVDEEAYGDTFFDASELFFVPVLDSEVDKSNSSVIYIDFWVGGNVVNDVDNIIYDIALVDLEVDCELVSPYLKWMLVKNGEVVSGGSFSNTFDTINDGRLVLTPIQQDLVEFSKDKSSYDYYEFYMWLSDSYQGSDLSNYNQNSDQGSLLGRKLKGKIEIELYGGSKKLLVRNPLDEIDRESCISDKEL